MESLKNKTQVFFTREDVTGEGNDTQRLENKIKEYNKTGQFIHSQLVDSQKRLTASTTLQAKHTGFCRESKLNRANYFLDPRSMMRNIHQKTHFKAAISVAAADSCCVKIGPNEFQEQFTDIARNM